MRQALGAKKKAACERVTGKQYRSCWVRGGGSHFWALCWYTERDADYVNWKTGEWQAEIREGIPVPDKD